MYTIVPELNQKEIDAIVRALFFYKEDRRELDPALSNDALREDVEEVEAIFERLWPHSTAANI